MGSARHLASVAPAETVVSSGPGHGWKASPEVPEGAVPPEDRLPAGKTGAEAALHASPRMSARPASGG